MAEPSALMEASRCYDQCIPDGAKLGVLIYLAMQQAGLDMTPSALMEASRCYDQCIPDGAKLAALLYLYENGGGGGGGGGTIQVYEGRDPAPPDDPTKAAVSYPTGLGAITQWNVGAQAWG